MDSMYSENESDIPEPEEELKSLSDRYHPEPLGRDFMGDVKREEGESVISGQADGLNLSQAETNAPDPIDIQKKYNNQEHKYPLDYHKYVKFKQD